MSHPPVSRHPDHNDPPLIAGPVPNPRRPALPPPSGAWDTHAHVFGPAGKFPFAPAGTAPEIVAKLNAGLNAVLRQPDIVARLAQLNVEARENTPEEFRAFVAEEIPRWSKVISDAGIKME